MTKYYKPTTLSYDRSVILSALLDTIKDSEVEKYGSIVIERKHHELINDVLKEQFKNIPSVRAVLLWVFSPGRTSSIHKDIPVRYEGDQTPFNKFALNIPLQTADLVHMKWFDEKEGAATKSTYVHSIGPSAADGLIYRLNGLLKENLNHNYIKPQSSPKIDEADAEQIDDVYYTQPNIVSINTWHSVTNESVTETAIFASIRFNVDITLEQLISKLGPA